MESGLITLIGGLAESGALTDTALLIIIITIIGLLHKNVFKPMQERVFSQPTLNDVTELTKKCESEKEKDFDELIEKFDKLLERLEQIDDYARDNSKEILNLKHDLDQVKQILNQFQGHMMYGERRSSDFGNKELR